MNTPYIRLLLISSMLIWGGSWSAAKVLSSTTPIDVLLFYRYLLTSLGCLVVLLATKKNPFKLTKRDILIVLLSGCLSGCYQGVFLLGLSTGLASTGGVIVTTICPVLTFFLMAVIHRKRLCKKHLAGLGLGLVSAILFIQIWNFDLSLFLGSGMGYFFTGALLWAVLTILTRYIDTHPFVYLYFVYTVPLPFFFFQASPQELLSAFSFGPMFWLNLCYLTLFSTCVASSVYFYCAKHLSPETAASYSFLVPASAIAVSVVLLGETPGWTVLIGGGLAIAAVYLLNRQGALALPSRLVKVAKRIRRPLERYF